MVYDDLLYIIEASQQDVSGLLVKKEEQLTKALADARNTQKQLDAANKKLAESDKKVADAIKSGNCAKISTAVTAAIGAGMFIAHKISDSGKSKSTAGIVKELNRRLNRLKKDRTSGKITEAQFMTEVQKIRSELNVTISSVK